MPRELFGYEVIGRLGDGAGSRIYAVSDPQTRKVFALKYVRPKRDKDHRFVEQLRAEFDVGSKVSHPGLRRCFDVKLKRSILGKVREAALIMELFDGRSLEDEPGTKLLPLVNVFVQVGQALESLHQLGYVHCDLKPNNILVDGRGQAKVIDLGQACRIGTAKKRIQGTPDYIAPEQVRCEPVSVRTDVFNLGATMYWVLTGRKLPTLFTLKKGVNSFLMDGTMTTPSELNPLIPETLSNLVMECVRSVPSKRPTDMSEVVRRLELIHFSMDRAAAPDASDARLDNEDSRIGRQPLSA